MEFPDDNWIPYGYSDDFVSYLGSYYFLQDPDDMVISASKDHIALSNQESGVSILYIASCHIKCSLRHNLVLHHVLHFFYRNGTIHLRTLKINILCNLLNLCLRQFFTHRCLICLRNRIYNLLQIKIYFRTISFNNLHKILTPSYFRPLSRYESIVTLNIVFA